MELQWLLLCQTMRLHQNGLMDIAGIFRTVTIVGEQLKPFMSMVAKVKFDPLLASEETTFIFRIAQIEGDWMEEIEMPFTYPTLEKWT